MAKIEGANTYYYHNDHLGTPQKMTDSTGVVVWSADYKPFGEATITTNTITNNLRFPGQYYDAETGLNYNYFRDYNPVIGRYIESDPLGLLPSGPRGGMNHLYVYADNNSLSKKDPLGLSETCTWAGFSAAIAAVVGVQIVRDTGVCVDDCGRTRTRNRTCICACFGAGASYGFGVQSGNSSSSTQGWTISFPLIAFTGDGGSLTGGTTGGPRFAILYCWCSCRIN
jgi:RHS repeat-associated protein